MSNKPKNMRSVKTPPPPPQEELPPYIHALQARANLTNQIGRYGAVIAELVKQEIITIPEARDLLEVDHIFTLRNQILVDIKKAEEEIDGKGEPNDQQTESN